MPLGDLAVGISFGKTFDERTNGRIRLFISKLETEKIRGVVEWVPAYTTVTVYYDPDIVSYEALTRELQKVDHSTRQSLQIKSLCCACDSWSTSGKLNHDAIARF